MRVTINTMEQLVNTFNEVHPEIKVVFQKDVSGSRICDATSYNTIVYGDTMSRCYDLFTTWIDGYNVARRVFNLGRKEAVA